MTEPFETMLTGGHPNSLGRTVEVVETVLTDPARFDELFACYQSPDEIVRLRTSNAMKRIEAVRRDLLLPYMDEFLGPVAAIDQASVQWTVMQLCTRMHADLTPAQQQKAQALMQQNLAQHEDWIVLNAAMDGLGALAPQDPPLRDWLRPHLERRAADPRKSVARRAAKLLATL